ncbi:MAG: hypothetical protein ACQES9_05480 [Myxococcota bacterium]
MRYYHTSQPALQLYKSQPHKYGFILPGAWLLNLILLLFSDEALDKLAWFPSFQGFSVLKLLASPFSWGHSKDYNMLGLLVALLFMWFLAPKVNRRLSIRRLLTYFAVTILPALGLEFLLSYFFYTGQLSLAVNILLVYAFALYRLNRSKIIIFKQYMLGKVKYIPWLLYGFTGLGFVLSLFDRDMSTAGYISSGLSLLLANIFFDPRLPAKWLRRFKFWRRKRKMWVIRGDRLESRDR